MRWTTLVLAAIALAVLPADAKNQKKKRGKGPDDQGGINPSSIAVVDTDLSMGPQDPADQIQAAAAHGMATGQGVLIAVLDGGFNPEHPALEGRMLPWVFNALDDQELELDDDDDAGGHGTFVAAMVLLAAPEATILPVRVRDEDGLGTNEELIRGIEFAMLMGADVINLSLDDAKARNREIGGLLNEVRRAGTVVVVSAGNDGEDSLPRLALGDDTLAVGAVDCCDRVADFSNFAEREPARALMIFAPGVDLHGPLGEDGMGFWSGTSFSAGIISGAAALVRERHPGLDPADVRDILSRSVEPVWRGDGEPVLSGGRINLFLAVSQ